MQQTDADDPAVDDLRRVGTVGVIPPERKAPNGLQVLVEGMVSRARRGAITGKVTSCRPESPCTRSSPTGESR